MVATVIRTIFAQPDATHVHEQRDVIAGMLAASSPTSGFPPNRAGGASPSSCRHRLPTLTPCGTTSYTTPRDVARSPMDSSPIRADRWWNFLPVVGFCQVKKDNH